MTSLEVITFWCVFNCLFQDFNRESYNCRQLAGFFAILCSNSGLKTRNITVSCGAV